MWGSFDEPEKVPPKGEFFCKNKPKWMPDIPGMVQGVNPKVNRVYSLTGLQAPFESRRSRSNGMHDEKQHRDELMNNHVFASNHSE